MKSCDEKMLDLRHHVVVAIGKIAALRQQGHLTEEQRVEIEGPLYAAVEIVNRHDREVVVRKMHEATMPAKLTFEIPSVVAEGPRLDVRWCPCGYVNEGPNRTCGACGEDLR